MGTIEREVCDLRHEQIGRAMSEYGQILSDHTGRIYSLEGGAALQAETMRRLQQMHDELGKRLADIQARPYKRWDKVLDEIIRWATLLILALVATKIGLG